MNAPAAGRRRVALQLVVVALARLGAAAPALNVNKNYSHPDREAPPNAIPPPVASGRRRPLWGKMTPNVRPRAAPIQATFQVHHAR